MNLAQRARKTRGENNVGGYEVGIDEQRREVRWQSQWSDKTSRKAKAIVKWVQSGGRLEVFVRKVPLQNFVRLGDVASMRLEREAQCLLQPGDEVIREAGGRKVHR